LAKPIILCLETATEVCSVALSQGENVLHELNLSEGQQHSSQLTILINECLKEAKIQRDELNAIGISNGPGSYTGLRVGASVAKGIAYALSIPMIAVPTLESLAYPFRDSPSTVISSIDARRMEAYIGIYKSGKEISPVTNMIWSEESFEKLRGEHGEIIICGNGIEKAKDDFAIPSGIRIEPSLCNADLLAPIAFNHFIKKQFVDLAYHAPFYYKSPNITVPKKMF